MNIVCLGDSITHASSFSERDRWPTVLQGMLERRRPAAFRVFNCGVGGDTTAQGIERMGAAVLPRMPGMVLVEFGFNDSCCREWQTKPRVGIGEFEANLVAIAAMVRKRKGTVAYLLNHVPVGLDGEQGDGVCYYRRVAAYNSVIRRVARRVRAPLVDWPGFILRRKLKGSDYLGDPVHLSEEGNHRYAECVFESLAKILAVTGEGPAK